MSGSHSHVSIIAMLNDNGICHTISLGRLQVNVTLCHQVKMSCHDVHHIMSRTRLSSQIKARSQYLLPVRNSSMVPITKSGPVFCNIAVMIININNETIKHCLHVCFDQNQQHHITHLHLYLTKVPRHFDRLFC